MEKPEVAGVTAAMRRKTTDALLEIWRENDRQTWSDAAFAAVRQVLEERGVEIPPRRAETAAESPPTPDDPDREPLVIATYAGDTDAEMARLLLEGEGIPCVVMGAVIGMVPGVSGEATGARIMVRKGDALRAVRVLESDRESRRRPTELMAASAPQGRGTELEAAGPGRGTELEAAGPGRGTEPEAATAPEDEPGRSLRGDRRRRWWP